MLTAINPAYQTPLSAAAPEIRDTLAEQRQRQRVQALVEELRGSHGVSTQPELIDAIELAPAPVADIPAGVPAAPRDPRAAPEIVEDDGV
jgi:hypothetical protein